MAIKDWVRNARGNTGGATTASRNLSVGAWMVVTAALVTLALGLSWYWSRQPQLAPLLAGADRTSVSGARTTATLIALVDTLLDKPGGYLTNDMLPPGLWLDNMPNWEFGVVVQVRDAAKAFREAFSRSQSQSTEDPDLALAEPLLNYDTDRWIFPATEDEYRKGRDHLARYYVRLLDGDESNAQFYARADNLRYWLGTVQSRLGSLSQRLGASVGQRRLGVKAGEGADVAAAHPASAVVKPSWWKIDDTFFEARGTAWALIQLLKAAEVDFADVLQKKNAQVSLRQIIRELEATQKPLLTPIILNGNGFGVLANHSITMASYISRANAALIDLRELLAQG
ncbi:MAG: DUF2333 family protein [Gammaproteobacteria bacterium]|jgi:hypothetical protein|nr:DUF2333 family protein [Gammaproteobacteria bacterium]